MSRSRLISSAQPVSGGGRLPPPAWLTFVKQPLATVQAGRPYWAGFTARSAAAFGSSKASTIATVSPWPATAAADARPYAACRLRGPYPVGVASGSRPRCDMTSVRTSARHSACPAGAAAAHACRTSEICAVVPAALAALPPDAASVTAEPAASRQPAQPAGQVPAPVPQHGHGRRHQDAADDGGVDQNGGGQADAEHLQLEHVQRGEDGEDRHHDDGGTGDNAGAAGDAASDGFPGGRTTGVQFADAAEDEDVGLDTDCAALRF